MKLIFEINSSQIKKRSLYDYCQRHDFERIKSTNNRFYYIKTETKQDRDTITEYLNKRCIQYFIYVHTETIEKWLLQGENI